MLFMALYIFARLFWRAHETLVKQHPGSLSLKQIMTWISNSIHCFIWAMDVIIHPCRGFKIGYNTEV